MGIVVEKSADCPLEVGQAVGVCLMGAFSEYLIVPAQIAIPLPVCHWKLLKIEKHD